MIDKLRELQARLPQEKLDQFKRRVSFGDLVTDRWQNAARPATFSINAVASSVRSPRR